MSTQVKFVGIGDPDGCGVDRVVVERQVGGRALSLILESLRRHTSPLIRQVPSYEERWDTHHVLDNDKLLAHIRASRHSIWRKAGAKFREVVVCLRNDPDLRWFFHTIRAR